MKNLLILALALGTMAAEAGETPAPGVSVRLVDEAVLDAIEARLMEDLRGFREQSCPRPVLRGEALPGSGSDAAAALIDPAGSLGPCLEVLEGSSEALTIDDWKDFLREGQGPGEEALTALRAACGGIGPAVSAAVAHGDLCSPWRPGVRGTPLFMPLLRLSKAAVILGRTGYRAAEAPRLLREALDRVRLDQDSGRGGGTLISSMIGVASTQIQVPWIAWILEQADLDEAATEAAFRELGILLDSVPPFGRIILADGFWMLLQVVLPMRHGPDWVPPGGFDADRPESGDPTADLLPAREFLDRHAEVALLMVATDRALRGFAEACPGEADLPSCASGLRAWAEKVFAANNVSYAVRLIRLAASKDMKATVADWIVDILLGISTASYDRYVARYAEVPLTLAALRIQAATLQSYRRDKVCPRADSMTGPDWDELLRDPVFGGRLSVQEIAPREYGVHPAAWFRDLGEEKAPWRYAFRCPPREPAPRE
ncbi:MAG: hypothetical protein FJ098_03995 [Deltaproteobacteria bacterium]|nr:hypothetical protein [Deltaproteobacteria bacterium]